MYHTLLQRIAKWKRWKILKGDQKAAGRKQPDLKETLSYQKQAKTSTSHGQNDLLINELHERNSILTFVPCALVILSLLRQWYPLRFRISTHALPA